MLDLVPKDVVRAHILPHLSDREALALSGVSQRFRSLCYDRLGAVRLSLCESHWRNQYRKNRPASDYYGQRPQDLPGPLKGFDTREFVEAVFSLPVPCNDPVNLERVIVLVDGKVENQLQAFAMSIFGRRTRACKLVHLNCTDSGEDLEAECDKIRSMMETEMVVDIRLPRPFVYSKAPGSVSIHRRETRTILSVEVACQALLSFSASRREALF